MRNIGVLILLFTLFTEFITVQSYTPPKYYMDRNCGGTINLSQPSMRLKLTQWSKYRSNMDCTLTIKASNRSATATTRLMVVFRKIDIATEFLMCNDYVTLRDGTSRSSPVLNGLQSKYCGEREPRGAYYTTADSLTVYFHSNLFDNDDGFYLLITPFHTGTCTSSETRCRRGQCISSDNKCDGYDQCGDRSDECSVTLRVGPIVGAVVSVLVIAIIVAVIFFICRRRRASRGYVKRTNDDIPQNIPMTQPPPVYPGQQPPYTDYQTTQPGYPTAQPGYPPAQPGYPPAQPGYPPAQPGYPPAGPPQGYNTAANPYPYGQPQ